MFDRSLIYQEAKYLYVNKKYMCVCVCEWKERIYSKRRDLKIKSNEKVEVNNWYVQSFWGYSGNELCRQHNFQEMLFRVNNVEKDR